MLYWWNSFICLKLQCKYIVSQHKEMCSIYVGCYIQPSRNDVFFIEIKIQTHPIWPHWNHHLKGFEIVVFEHMVQEHIV